MTSSNKNTAIAYMPYLCMRGIEEIDFGFLKIWNFNRKKVIYIPDPIVRNHIEKLLHTYKAYQGTVEDIGIITIGETDFKEFNDDDFEKIRLARLILFLSCISRTNTLKPDANAGHSMITSENFDLIYQRFIVGSDIISNNSGAIVNIRAGGFDVNKISFQKPDFVLTPMRFDTDKELLSRLISLQTKRPRVFQKIINAAEIFFESYYNAQNVSRNARVLLQMSAFEILLNLPNDNLQRKHFKDAIGKYSNKNTDKLYIYKYERRGRSKGVEHITLKEIWADSFYTLRNHIIHGDNPKHKDFLFQGKQIHTDIALLFFVLCIKKQMGVSVKEYYCDSEIEWEKWTNPSGMNPSKMESFVYKHRFNWKGLIKQYSKRKTLNY